MKLGNYTLRKPWTKLVDIPIEEELYDQVRASIVEDILSEIKDDCNQTAKLLEAYKER